MTYLDAIASTTDLRRRIRTIEKIKRITDATLSNDGITIKTTSQLVAVPAVFSHSSPFISFGAFLSSSHKAYPIKQNVKKITKSFFDNIFQAADKYKNEGSENFHNEKRRIIVRIQN